jgi:hypothetical protein
MKNNLIPIFISQIRILALYMQSQKIPCMEDGEKNGTLKIENSEPIFMAGQRNKSPKVS